MTRRSSARLHATDAAFLPSPSFPGSSDQYVTFAFDTTGGPAPTLEVLRDLVRRATAGHDVFATTVLPSPFDLDHPRWVRASHDPDHCVTTADAHPRTWNQAQDDLARIMATRLDPTTATWHLHLLPVVTGVPGSTGTSAVVVLQVCHALVDGRGAGAMARALFGPRGDRAALPSVRTLRADPGPRRATATDAARMIARGLSGAVGAVRASVASRRATVSDVPASPVRHPVSFASVAPATDRATRVLVIPVDRLRAPGRTVTVSALTAVSIAMERVSRDQHSESGTMAAHVTVALPDDARWGARNRFLPAMVDLAFGTPDVSERAARIAVSLEAGRRRAGHPTVLRRYETGNDVPRPLMRAFGPTPQPPAESVLAHTSFSSVHRGPADLRLGDAPVLFTAGFPALSLASSLSHGVYTIGDTATVSVLWSPGSLPGMHGYVDVLEEALSALAS
ncbi:wax ester/triacylglycerol synthase domain-containing protein [Rhodococcoides corynebacterioides]|uniref:wax ester/triacylglycerol synthase domain-containing protein n=1 Tax=Rhodococcoides corynebacterioides TaxID=53972 RepID=UPI001C9A7BDB|nr:wax ester/triacylglycerol synthase domain-containing protein [Rhodococcus corynebacterioides]MBY6350148.1 hypothetical protein [Rhodococcus corynebacterioides]MBY6362263.1 hypothetical protein [Rhodococcus corynebacterioides]